MAAKRPRNQSSKDSQENIGRSHRIDTSTFRADKREEIDALIAKSQSDFRVAGPEAVRLRKEMEKLNSLWGLNLSWDALNKDSDYAGILKTALLKNGNKYTGRARPRKYTMKMLALDPIGDSPVIASIKQFGLEFVENRGRKSSRQEKGGRVGEIVSVEYLNQLISKKGGAVLIGKPGDENLKRGAHTLDIVAIVGKKLVIIEAKANSSELESSMVTDDDGTVIEARQGSIAYLRYKMKHDDLFFERLQEYDSLHQTSFSAN